MSAPAIIYIVLMAIGLLAAAHEHGKPKEGKNNFFYSLLGTTIVAGLLYWGGLFK